MCEPYSNWKLLIDLWSVSTDYTAVQQGPMIVLSLKGDARDAALGIPKDELKSENGVELILKKLDTLYEKDESQLAFISFDQFVKYRRPDNMDIREFLRKFELMKNKCESYKFVLPENIVAYFMLACANLPDDKSDIIRATVPAFTSAAMRSQILKVYTEAPSTSASGSQSMPLVKNEPNQDESFPMMYADNYDDGEFEAPKPMLFEGYSRGYRKNRGRGRGRYRKSSYRGSYSGNKSYGGHKLNPLDESGQPSQCNKCRSIYHWEDDCPVAKSQSRRSQYSSSSSSQRFENAL